MFQLHRKTFISLELSCSAKIKQLQGPIALQHQVVRTDVAVNHIFCVDLLQSLYGRPQKREQLLPCHGAVFIHVMLQIRAAQVFHDEIRCIVRGKEAHHIHNAGNAAKLCQNTRFVQKAPLHGVICSVTVLCDRDSVGYFIVAIRVSSGEEFLDRNYAVKLQIAPDVGNSKTTLAKGTPNEILPHQYGSRSELVRGRFGINIVSAERTFNQCNVLQFMHAVEAVVLFSHRRIPLSEP